MRKQLLIPVLFCAGLVSACGGGGSGGGGTGSGNDFTASRFVTPDATGRITSPVVAGTLEVEQIPGITPGGIAYDVRTTVDGKFTGLAGLLPNTSGGTVPTTGTAFYSGTYYFAKVDNFRIENNLRVGDKTLGSNPLTLRVEFDSNIRAFTNNLTPTGGLDNVQGRFDAQGNMTGTVRFEGVTGDLTGVLGGDRAVGSFHGNSDTLVYAGGFIVD